MGNKISRTPAPMKDRIYGSKKNKVNSAKNLESSRSIKFDEKTLTSIKNKVDEHNKKYPNKKITLASAKAVVRRGMGAYSGSHRPTISGGKPNSRTAWGLARLNAFIYKIINGESKSGKYSQDNDLINELGYNVAKFDDGGRTLTRLEIEAMRRTIKDPLVSPRLKESFEKVLRSRKIDDSVDISRFPEGRYIDTYDFSGYEYMKRKNEEMGVSFLLTGEYQLVSQAIYERDYAMWLFYNYLGRINISFESCKLWLREAQQHFSETMPIPVFLQHKPNAKDGRSYAMWMVVSKSQIEKAESKTGLKFTWEYDGKFYTNEIGMVGNYDYKGTKYGDGWGTYYEEKKTGLFVPEYTETSFHFNTLIHEFAHCLDFQAQLLENIKKLKADQNKKGKEKEYYFNTETMSDLEKELYGSLLIKEEETMSFPITNHFDFFIDSLIKVLRASAGGFIPLTQKFEQQALDVQTALSGLYGDLLLAQREKRKRQSEEIKELDEVRQNKRFTWQTPFNKNFYSVIEGKIIQKDLLNSISGNSPNRKLSLSEAIELLNVIKNEGDTFINRIAVERPSKIDDYIKALQSVYNEADRIINNHFDNIKRDYPYGEYPVTELDKYIHENCRANDYRDYKSWKECNLETLLKRI